MDAVESSAPVVIGRTRWEAIGAVARPYQWLKNGLVFAALVFSERLFSPHDLVLACIAFASFCAISSAGYVLNDLNDREVDRHHPEKRKRPIAAGELAVGD